MYDLVVGGSHKVAVPPFAGYCVRKVQGSEQPVLDERTSPVMLCCYGASFQWCSRHTFGEGVCFRDTFGMHGCLGAWVGDRLMPLRTYCRRGNGSPLNGSL